MLKRRIQKSVLASKKKNKGLVKKYRGGGGWAGAEGGWVTMFSALPMGWDGSRSTLALKRSGTPVTFI